MRARAAYLGAVQRLSRAMRAFYDAQVPLEPDDRGGLAPWTSTHVMVMRECAEAWPAVVARRQTYDALLREFGSPEAPPET